MHKSCKTVGGVPSSILTWFSTFKTVKYPISKITSFNRSFVLVWVQYHNKNEVMCRNCNDKLSSLKSVWSIFKSKTAVWFNILNPIRIICRTFDGKCLIPTSFL